MKTGAIFTDYPVQLSDQSIRNLKCTSFLLLDDDHGPVLFDTGSIYDRKTFRDKLNQQFNLDYDDIQYVFITHIHPDHIGSIRYFKKAKIFISKNELLFGDKIAKTVFKNEDLLKFLHSNCPGYKKSFTQIDADGMKKAILNFWNDDDLGLNNQIYFLEEQLNLPSFIQAIPSHGHTFYHYSYLIQHEQIPILISGDALSMKMILRDMNHDERSNEPHMDFDQYQKSLIDIEAFKGLIIPGHDRPFYTHSYKSIRKPIFDINPQLIISS